MDFPLSCSETLLWHRRKPQCLQATSPWAKCHKLAAISSSISWILTIKLLVLDLNSHLLHTWHFYRKFFFFLVFFSMYKFTWAWAKYPTTKVLKGKQALISLRRNLTVEFSVLRQELEKVEIIQISNSFLSRNPFWWQEALASSKNG